MSVSVGVAVVVIGVVVQLFKPASSALTMTHFILSVIFIFFPSIHTNNIAPRLSVRLSSSASIHLVQGLQPACVLSLERHEVVVVAHALAVNQLRHFRRQVCVLMVELEVSLLLLFLIMMRRKMMMMVVKVVVAVCVAGTGSRRVRRSGLIVVFVMAMLMCSIFAGTKALGVIVVVVAIISATFTITIATGSGGLD